MHRWCFATLALGLPALLGAALWARYPALQVSRLPIRLKMSGQPSLWRERCHVAGFAGEARILDESRLSSERSYSLELIPEIQEPRPDLLVYWTPDETLNPETSRLLGPVETVGLSRFPLPAEIRQGGRFFFYSLAQRELRGSIKLPLLP